MSVELGINYIHILLLYTDQVNNFSAQDQADPGSNARERSGFINMVPVVICRNYIHFLMADDVKIGAIFGHYRIISKIGAGGMGEVYLAADSLLDRQVALKILHTDAAGDGDRIRRFVQEAKAASGLNHPNILTIHEIGTHEGSHYIATELIKGETLRDRLEREWLSLRDTLDVASQVAAALNAAHESGIVHRDIKPENLMVRDDGLVKVLDFGLAKLSERNSSGLGSVASENTTHARLTAPGAILGTPIYMSPEQARGKQTDARTDIWSLGIVLFEMLTGQTPFAGETNSDSIAAILTREPPSLPESVPMELQRIVKKSLQKQTDERYQTVKDLLLDLKNLKRELEFSEELERSHILPFPRPQNVSTTGLGDNITAGHGANLTDRGLSHRASSAEYVVTEVRKHKALSIIAFVLVVFGSVGFGYWYMSRPAQSINAIAILPFANVGSDPANEYLSDGVSEGLINTLSRLPQLKVIARSSAFRYKGKEIDPQEVAESLGVGAIVTGRIVTRGDTLNTSVEMINAADRTQMWGETYHRKVLDAQDIQEEIVRMISEKLRVKLSGSQQRELAKHATQNDEAYHLYTNGVYHRRKGGSENGHKALAYFEQALGLDPDFALAHVAVADVYSFLGGNSLIDPGLARAKGMAAVERALALDGSLADAHAVLANFKRNDWEWALAEREYEQAIELNPNLARAYNDYAHFLATVGRPEEALNASRRALELDPLDMRARSNRGYALYYARRYDEAIQTFQDILKAEPNRSITHAILADIFAITGEYAKALEHYNKNIEIAGRTTSVQCYVGYALANSGKRDEASEILRMLEATKEYVSPAELAILYVGLGDTERALASLEKAFGERDLQLQFLRGSPHYDPLRSDPRFQELVRRVGLPQ